MPFAYLLLFHGEIGLHRGRKAGFREVFRLHTLRGLPFTSLANKVKDAYQGKHVPSHEGWPDQRESLRWFVEKGVDGIYALSDKPPARVEPSPYQRYYITDGHHRALALYILGESEIRARIERS